MSLINRLIEKLQRHPKRVVFPEGSDPRILQAARQFVTRRLGVPVLVGDRSRIKENAAGLDIRLDGMRIVEPARSDDFGVFLNRLRSLPRFGEMDEAECRETVANGNTFAALMLGSGRADALVAGATAAASSGLGALFRIIPTREGVGTASSMQILDTENTKVGIGGTLFLADCAVIPDPTDVQLAEIASTTAEIAYHLTDDVPRVALLSHTTKSPSPGHPSAAKMRSATRLAQERLRSSRTPAEVDGELQVDAALDPLAARMKGVAGPVAGRANVLIFPDLNSANIASKLVQILTGGCSYGQIITGLSRPCAEISRGASAHDIFGTAVIAACQAIDHRLLFREEVGEGQTHASPPSP